MIRSFSLAVFLAMLSLGCVPSEAGTDTVALVEDDPLPIEWIDFADALAMADESGKAILVDVYATWCPWCAKMQDSVYTRTDIRSYVNTHFVTARLDVEQVDDTINFKGYSLNSAQLASGFGAEATPTTVFLTSTGDYITRLPGYLDAEGFMRVLKYIGTETYKEKSFQEFVEGAD